MERPGSAREEEISILNRVSDGVCLVGPRLVPRERRDSRTPPGRVEIEHGFTKSQENLLDEKNRIAYRGCCVDDD